MLQLMSFYRRNLPHIQADNKAHFVTFCTKNRWVLPAEARKTVLDACLFTHKKSHYLHVAVVMPDHVHMIFTPLVDMSRKAVVSLAEIMKPIKSFSSHQITKRFGVKSPVWQEESFDHVARSWDSLEAKIDYVLQNPVRRGLVARWQDYPWLWRSP